MKTAASLLLILILAFAVFGQVKATTEYKFPVKDSEFSVTFPGEPVFEAAYGNEMLAVSAALKTSNSFIRAEIAQLTEKQAKMFAKKDDSALAAFPMSYAAAAAMYNATVKTGKDAFGRYAKVRTYKNINGVETTFEIWFYLGRGEIITLYTGAESTAFPTSEITKFLDSLKSDSSFDATKTKGARENFFSGGSLNGKARSLPRPDYPAAAKMVRASGEVVVQIKIDENGNVLSAAALNGHPLLRQASEKAALQATFNPLELYGQKIKVTGVIVYHFYP